MASRPRDERAAPTGAELGGRWEPSERDSDRLVAELERPTLVLRARVLARRRTLDEQLAEGLSPARNAVLALRARQLVSSARRQQVATKLERLVDAAQRAPCLGALSVPLPRREIRELRPVLLGVAACLRTERPVYARGMALLTALLTDGGSPVYTPGSGVTLHDAIRTTAEALDGHWPRESGDERASST
jgi:hypothetical protein